MLEGAQFESVTLCSLVLLSITCYFIDVSKFRLCYSMGQRLKFSCLQPIGWKHTLCFEMSVRCCTYLYPLLIFAFFLTLAFVHCMYFRLVLKNFSINIPHKWFIFLLISLFVSTILLWLTINMCHRQCCLITCYRIIINILWRKLINMHEED